MPDDFGEIEEQVMRRINRARAEENTKSFPMPESRVQPFTKPISFHPCTSAAFGRCACEPTMDCLSCGARFCATYRYCAACGSPNLVNSPPHYEGPPLYCSTCDEELNVRMLAPGPCTEPVTCDLCGDTQFPNDHSTRALAVELPATARASAILRRVRDLDIPPVGWAAIIAAGFALALFLYEVLH